MKTNSEFRNQVLKNIFSFIKDDPSILAAWEGGSIATGTIDQFSDIDLCVLTDFDLQATLQKIEDSISAMGITHAWRPTKCPWGPGMAQRVLILKDSPKHFLVDIAVLDIKHSDLLNEFLQIERHGNSVIHFDKANYLKPTHADAGLLFEKQQVRVKEISEAFVVFKSLVEKELERGRSIDAISFYQNGLLRPYIELLGMLYRPYRWDFGMRYLHRDFPKDTQEFIQKLSYVANPQQLASNVLALDAAFQEAVKLVKQKTTLLNVPTMNR